MVNKTYKANCQQFFELLAENRIRFFLVAGTLLGAIREGKFIDHDDDIDIGIFAEDRERFIEVISNSGWYFYQIWRREIGVMKHSYSKAESKIDVFFIDKDNEHSYMYQYKKNPFSSIWDIEWRMKFPRDVFNELIPSNISDIKCFVPKNAKTILDLEYTNDWKTPNPKWINTDAPAVDKDYKEVAIIIPTFLRDEKLKNLVESIPKYLPIDKYKIYIADQGLYNEEKNKYYESLRGEGHFVSYLPFNSGLSYCRNFLVKQTKEPFILLVDDDFLFTEDTNIQNFIYILNNHDELGVIGGRLNEHEDYHFRLIQQKDKVYYIRLKYQTWFKTIKTYLLKPIPFIFCDIVLNFAMFKRELFNDHRWDNELKLAEHSYFYLKLKQLKKWRVAFTDTVIADHKKHDNNTLYQGFRAFENNKLGVELFYKKMGLKEQDFITIIEE